MVEVKRTGNGEALHQLGRIWSFRNIPNFFFIVCFVVFLAGSLLFGDDVDQGRLGKILFSSILYIGLVLSLISSGGVFLWKLRALSKVRVFFIERALNQSVYLLDLGYSYLLWTPEWTIIHPHVKEPKIILNSEVQRAYSGDGEVCEYPLDVGEDSEIAPIRTGRWGVIVFGQHRSESTGFLSGNRYQFDARDYMKASQKKSHRRATNGQLVSQLSTQIALFVLSCCFLALGFFLAWGYAIGIQKSFPAGAAVVNIWIAWLWPYDCPSASKQMHLLEMECVDRLVKGDTIQPIQPYHNPRKIGNDLWIGADDQCRIISFSESDIVSVKRKWSSIIVETSGGAFRFPNTTFFPDSRNIKHHPLLKET